MECAILLSVVACLGGGGSTLIGYFGFEGADSLRGIIYIDTVKKIDWVFEFEMT